MQIMKGHISAMFSGKASLKLPVTFPQSHIIYAGSIQQAHEIIKKGGYFVVSSEDVQLFKASATPDVIFKIATDGLTPAFSDLLGFKSEKGCKTFFAKEYKKLRISLGEDGKTTDWILMKQAKQCNNMTTTGGDFIVNKRALVGTVTTSCLPEENHNYKKQKPAEGWRKERKNERKALTKSPAYIRGSLFTPAKKRKPNGQKGKANVEQVIREEIKVGKVTEEENREVSAKKTKVKKVVTKEGGIKCSRYFAFVRKILEKKS